MDDQYDLEVALQAVKAISEIMKIRSLKDIVEEELLPGKDVQSDEDILAFIKKITMTMWHPVGTCKMGIDEMSVVDANLAVYGIANLYVMDASIMPTITSGNTNAPTQALALVAIKRFVENHYVQKLKAAS